ncbi:MAG: TonB-dependent receptor plug domain-containing protein [bacterium]
MKGLLLSEQDVVPTSFHKYTNRLKILRVYSLSKLLLLFALLNSGCWGNRFHHTNGKDRMDLTKLEIEELVEVEFVTVFKKPAKVFEAPAAVYLIDEQAIRASGGTNIPDVLRSVPGIQVAQHNAHSWSVTSRGFSGLSRGVSGQFANKLLVLSDGRAIYTPLFSGVSWSAQDVLLDDVERIEVIRGPGASLWGANAVNGIINIVSKDAKKTQGGLASSGVGTEQRAFGQFRYGGVFGGHHYFRIYGKYIKVDDLVDAEGRRAADGWHTFQGGFRLDSHVDYDKVLTFQGEIYDGVLGQTYNLVDSDTPPYQRVFDFDSDISGAHLLGRWKQSFSTSSDLELQVYFDRVKRLEAAVRGRIHTFDFDFHHRFAINASNEVIWGAGYRFTSDKFDSTFNFSLNPASRETNLVSAFFQNETTILPDRLSLTVGSKFEKNDYSGFEIQPSARLMLTANDRNTLWGAISRAVRTPSRGEDDGRLVLAALEDQPPTTFQILFGNRDFGSENVLSLGGGYRYKATDALTLDISTFYNDYNNLRTDEPIGLQRESPNFVLASTLANKMSGQTYGLEFSMDWQVLRTWRFNAAYSYLKMSMQAASDSKDTFAETIEGQSPSHQLFLNSFVQPGKRFEFDVRFRFVDNLPSLGVPSYATADLRVGWHITPDFEFSVMGQNLLDSHHPESSSSLTKEDKAIQSGTLASEIQRGVFTKVVWRF